jgi:UDP-N-acetylmuramate--alanine ligase
MIPFKKIHIVGIAGSGLNGIANILIQMDCELTGADKSSSPTTRFFEKLGVNFFLDTDITPLETAELVLITSALPSTHPIIIEAKKRNIPVWTRHQLFPVLFNDKKVIAVSGSHGKTTTTSIVKHILQSQGVDCGYLIGVPDPRASGYLGSSEYFVVEADEYAKTFLSLTPHIAIINNIDWDHPDIYPTEKEYIDTFKEFIDITIANNGLVICNGDDKNIQNILQNFDETTLKNNFRIFGKGLQNINHLKSVRHEANGIRLGVFLEHSRYVNNDIFTPFRGEHNAMNIMTGLLVAENLDLELNKVAISLKNLTTVNRRMDLKGVTKNGVQVFDDYAHAPTEIKATLTGLKKAFPNRKLIAVWQPHGFDRILQYKNDFVQSLKLADEIIITPIYGARSEGEYDFAEFKLGLNRFSTYFIDSKDQLLKTLTRLASNNDIIILLNAGDLNKNAKDIIDSINLQLA